MATTVVEKFGSREHSVENDRSFTTYLYAILGSDDDEEVYQALVDATGGITGGVDPSGERRAATHISQVGPLIWDAMARYEFVDSQPKQTGETAFSFDTSGGTAHITQSKQTTNSYGIPSLSTADFPSFGGAIGVSQDGSIEGCDIVVPQYAFTGTLYMDPSDVTEAYIDSLYRLTGKTNAAVWTCVLDGISQTFQPGEVLFRGARGSRRGRGDVEISFDFAANPNVTGLSVGDIKNISKQGWEVLWVYYKPKKLGNNAASLIGPAPYLAFTERVYDAGDFSQLRIPSS